LVEAIKQLVKHSTNLQREYIKRQTKQSMRYMKPNLDDTLFIKKYHKVLTDNAIRLAREANNFAIKCHDNWEIEENQNYYKFTNPVSNPEMYNRIRSNRLDRIVIRLINPNCNR